jgi:hypothetical protein
MSRDLQIKLCDPTIVGVGMKLASLSAFPIRGDMDGKIIAPLKEGDLECAPPQCRLAMQVMSDSITSLRQAVEWGMGAACKVYRQLPLPLPFNPKCRALRLNNVF